MLFSGLSSCTASPSADVGKFGMKRDVTGPGRGPRAVGISPRWGQRGNHVRGWKATKNRGMLEELHNIYTKKKNV